MFNLNANVIWFYKTPSFKGIYTLIFIFILLFSLLLFMPYQKNKVYYGQVLLDNRLLLYVEEENRIYLKNVYSINEKKTKCSLEKSNQEYLISNNIKYFEIYLDCEFDKKYFENEILEVKVTLPKTTLLKKLKKRIMKGITT